MRTGSVYHLKLLTQLVSPGCGLAELLHSVNSTFDLVKDVTPHEASKEGSNQVGNGIFESPVSFLDVHSVEVGHILPSNLGQSDGGVENATRHVLKAGVKSDPANDDAYDHGEGVTAAGNLVLSSKVKHNEEHSANSLCEEDLAVGGEPVGAV